MEKLYKQINEKKFIYVNLCKSTYLILCGRHYKNFHRKNEYIIYQRFPFTTFLKIFA